jgi:hypothetical protein
MYGGLPPPPPLGGWNLPGPNYNALIWRDSREYPGTTELYCEMCSRKATGRHLQSQNHNYWLGEFQRPQAIAGTRPRMHRPQAELTLGPPPPKAAPPAPPEWPAIGVLAAAGPQVAAVLRAGAVTAPTTQGGATAAGAATARGQSLETGRPLQGRSPAAGAATGATVSTTQGNGTASLAAGAATAPTTLGSGTPSSAAGGATAPTTQDSGTLSSVAGGATVSTTRHAVVTPSPPPTNHVGCLTAFWAAEAKGPRAEVLVAKSKALPPAFPPLEAAQKHAAAMGVATLAAGANLAAAELAAQTGAGGVQRTTQYFSIAEDSEWTDINTPLPVQRQVSFADSGEPVSAGLAGAAPTDAQVVSGPPVGLQVASRPAAPGDRPAPLRHISAEQMMELQEYICEEVQERLSRSLAMVQKQLLKQLAENRCSCSCCRRATALGQTEEPLDRVTGGGQPEEEAA